MNISMLRTRWAAIGAAVAVTLGAGGLGISYAATNPAGSTTYVPITPCRLVDTRTPGTVGPRNTPIGAGETYNVTARGDNGACTGIPTSATSLELNVTALGASSGTFLTLWATGGTRPEVSHLNPQPGAPPIPNSVTTGLSTGTSGGQFSIFNAAGSVNVLIDVVGYYADHTHDSGSITNESGISTNFDSTPTALAAAVTRVTSVPVRVPSDGYLIVEAQGIFQPSSAGSDEAWCQLTKGATPASLEILANTQPWVALNDFNTTGSELVGFSTHRIFNVSAADNPSLFTAGQTFGLDCFEIAGTTAIDDVLITATFYPTSYAPLNFTIPGFPIFPLFPSEGEIAPPSE